MRKTVQIPGLQANSTYAIQIRGVDSDGSAGQWSSQFRFLTVVDEVAPAPVVGLSVDVEGPDFVIDWTAPTTNEDGSQLDDLRDYKVSITAGGITKERFTLDEGFVLTFGLNRNLFVTPRPSISVNVQARDRVGNLSAPVIQTAVNPPPTAPSLIATAKRNAVELTWTDAFADDGHYYSVYKNLGEYARVAPDTLIWTDTDVGVGPQEYFIRAHDVFGQTADSNVATQAEVELEIFTDEIAPKPPTNLSLSSELTGPGVVRAALSWVPPVEDTDNTSYTDNEGFELRYRFSVSRPWTYLRVPDLRMSPDTDSNPIEVDIDNLPAGETMSWEVRAFDRSLNYSTWASRSDTLALDNIPPDAPTGLSVSGGIRTILASWVKNSEEDLAGYRVYASTSPGVTVSGANLKFDGLGTSASFSAGEGETWHVIVVAYDFAGNVSAPSAEATATTLSLVFDDTPPSNVSGLQLAYQLYYHGSSEMARIRATWSPATDDTGVYGYILAWRQQLQDESISWTEVLVTSEAYTLTGIQLSELDDTPNLEDEQALRPSTYSFRVKAVDAAGNFSTDWSPVASITIDPDGEAPRGEIKREVPVTFEGAIQSDNFVGLLRGFRLSERSLEIYGDEEHDVSLLIGSGGQGMNISTVNNQFWFGARNFENAIWRVGPGGEQRSGGPGALAERLLDAAIFIRDTAPIGPAKIFYQELAPTATSTSDIWSDGEVLYLWSGSVWVDQGEARLAVSISRAFDALFFGPGDLTVYAQEAEPVTANPSDLWINDSLVLRIYRESEQEADGIIIYTSEWFDMFSTDDAFNISAEGDIWSGGDSPFTAPWSITANGRARFSDISIFGGEFTTTGAPLIAVSSDTGESLLSLRKSNSSDWEFRIGMDTFIDDGGNLELSGGDINLSRGGIYLSGGSEPDEDTGAIPGGVFEMSGGRLNLTGTPITMDGSDFTINSGNIILNQGFAAGPNPTGVIQSADYDYEQRQGWALDSGNLYLFSGEISASLIDVQNEQNLLDFGYTTMAYPPEWYSENVQVSSGAFADLTSVWSRYGRNGLQLQGNSLATFQMVGNLPDDSGPDFSRIRVEPGVEYIFSTYAHNLSVSAKTIQLFFVVSDGSEISSTQFEILPGATERISFVGEVPTPGPGFSNTGAFSGVRILSEDTNMVLDGMQFEQRTGSNLPSTFNIGGGTTIDGGSIKTGAIVSNNYLAGSTGWKIGMDGTVEFQGGIFRGQLFASDLVSGTIDNQEFLLSDIESLIVDRYFEDGWEQTNILSNSTP